jgi:hypothetical protein
MDRDFFLAHVATDERNGLTPEQLPPRLILLAQPAETDLQGQARPEVLRDYWRLLFQARLRLSLDKQLAGVLATGPDLQRRQERIGRAEFAECREILLEEGYLDPQDDDGAVHVQLAATHLTFARFSPQLLPIWFPALCDREDLPGLFGAGLEVETLLADTRLSGAADLPTVERLPEHDSLPEGTLSSVEVIIPPAPQDSPPRSGPLTAIQAHLKRIRAQRVEQRGNVVLAALLHMQLMAASDGTEAAAQAEQARRNVARLAERLQVALGLSYADREDWHAALVPLLRPAAHGFWPAAARLLYDLQKVCVDHECGLYQVDLRGWLLSLGKQPLRRSVPAQREVLMVKHLRSARRRLYTVPLAGHDRKHLDRLLKAALDRARHALRDWCRPRLAAALDKVGLIPANYPELISRDKIGEELLDCIDRQGLLTLGEVRDAIARNQLKLPDLAGSAEFLHGDKLLRLNGELAKALEGIYHPGEFYLRWLQSSTSLLFGTAAGRLLTRYLLLPFGGAFVSLVALQEIAHLCRQLLGAGHGEQTDGAFHPPPWWGVGLLGLFFFLLMHVPAFRAGTARALRITWRALRTVFWDWPVWLSRQRAVRAVLDSRPVVFARRYLLKPALFGLATVAALLLLEYESAAAALTGIVAFVVLASFFATRPGRILEEIALDWTFQHWHYFSIEVVPALFHFVMDSFKWAVGEIERLLYSVDQWLRFHRSESQLTLIGKGVLALVWSGFAYLVRSLVILVLEPTFNPIKHFPVVTVAAKLMLPVYAVLLTVFFGGIEQAKDNPLASGLLALVVVGAVPGTCGFLVWELKESWRLYAANRPGALRPVLIGQHGETMSRLLRPGFHSGTIPKLYRKWRQAERRGRAATARHCRAGLHHVEEALRHFVHREFIHLLGHSSDGHDLRLSVASIHLTVQSVQLELVSRHRADERLILALQLRGGWLLAQLRLAVLLEHLPTEQRRQADVALQGLYKLAAVQLMADQVCAPLAELHPVFDVKDRRLVVWPDGDYQVELIYDLREHPQINPCVRPPDRNGDWPVLETRRVVFAEQPLTWAEWVAFWDSRHKAKVNTASNVPDAVTSIANRAESTR